ncbi:cyclopentanone-monooxygenase, partial [Moniliophthora roreri]
MSQHQGMGTRLIVWVQSVHRSHETRLFACTPRKSIYTTEFQVLFLLAFTRTTLGVGRAKEVNILAATSRPCLYTPFFGFPPQSHLVMYYLSSFFAFQADVDYIEGLKLNYSEFG